MSFRTRLLIAVGLAAILPLLLLMYGVRREMTGRLSRQADAQEVEAIAEIRDQLMQRGRASHQRLRAMGSELAADNRFRLAVLAGDASSRAWLRDWAPQAMAAAGFAVLQLQDSAGRVLSSGHFRNQFDQLAPMPVAHPGAWNNGQLVMLRALAADTTLTAFGALDSFRVADRLFLISGGSAIDPAVLTDLSSAAISVGVGMPWRSESPPSSDEIAGTVVVPLVDLGAGPSPGGVDSGAFILARDPGPLAALRQSVDRWFLFALIVTVATALLFAAWLSARLSRPLALLAEKTGRVDLDRLDQDFATDRDDEVGALSRLLDTMTGRLRSSAQRLREAERRAAVGDLARQINHDVKNGLAPIRHVLRHLSHVAEREPDKMAAIFKERVTTLDSSIEYLDTLARNYARLSPALDRGRSDVNGLIREVAQTIPAGSIKVETRLASPLAPVQADPVVLRRILENLVTNGVDAMSGQPGQLTLQSENVDTAPNRIRICVADTGRGMSREELDRAFDDFFTTKDGGTGLGLSVVRRLISDLGGTLRVETAPGQGSRFIVELPAAPELAA